MDFNTVNYSPRGLILTFPKQEINEMKYECVNKWVKLLKEFPSLFIPHSQLSIPVSLLFPVTSRAPWPSASANISFKHPSESERLAAATRAATAVIISLFLSRAQRAEAWRREQKQHERLGDMKTNTESVWRSRGQILRIHSAVRVQMWVYLVWINTDTSHRCERLQSPRF